MICTACAAKPVYVYQDIYIPQKCRIETPVKPVKSDNAGIMLNDLIQYTHELEYALNACKGE
jgi:hypothetical protein